MNFLFSCAYKKYQHHKKQQNCMNEEYQAYLRDKKFKESTEKQQEEASADLTQAALDSGLLNLESLAHLQNTVGKQLDLFGEAMTREQPTDKMTQWRNNLTAGLEVEKPAQKFKSPGVYTTETDVSGIGYKNHYDTPYADFNSVKANILESARIAVERLASNTWLSAVSPEEFRNSIVDSMAQLLPDFMGDFDVKPVSASVDGSITVDVDVKFRNSSELSHFRAMVLPNLTSTESQLSPFGLSASDLQIGLPGITGSRGPQGLPGTPLEIYDGKYVHFQRLKADIMQYNNYLAENLDKAISYSEYLAENLDESIEKINKAKDYADYLATNLDKALRAIDALEERLKLAEERLSVFTAAESMRATISSTKL